eukprot:TRINITY_DN2372_c0_g1_i2.p1 TRINITY_DN2372_c0_g1~~TRINITY_DN2372_c0_g1_i2.p1  ORF type:complete len:374 (+),score=49.72 TRINITY_DN2372_c0_g1_i2:284-1405(+)
MFVMPLLSIVSGYNPSPQAWQQGFQIVKDQMNQMSLSDLAIVLWGSARMGQSIDQTLLNSMKDRLKQQINQGSVSDISAILFSLSLMNQLDEDIWTEASSRLNTFGIKQFSEVDLFHLAYTGMLRASKAAEGQQALPRPSLDEVKTALTPLYRRLQGDCVKKYKEYSPFHPYIDSVYMTISFMMSRLYRVGSLNNNEEHDFKLPLISPQFKNNIEETLKDSKRMGQLKRAIFFHWRKDELLDPWQKSLNEIIFILQRRMGEIVKQEQDADAVLPNRKVILFLKEKQIESVRKIDVPSVGMAMMRYVSPDTVGGGDKFVLKENLGVKNAKIQQFKQRGWKVLIIEKQRWENLKDNDEKEAFLRQAVVEIELGLV